MTSDSQQSDHTTGAITVTLGVLILSFDALLIRLADAPAWDVVFWRGAFMAFSLFLVISFQKQRNSMQRFISFGWTALFTALLQGVGSALFVLAVSHTSVANTVVLIATAPLFAAIASHFFLKERVHLRTWISCVIVVLGVGLVFSSAIELEQNTGNIYAILAAMTLGGNLTILRRHHDLPRMPVVAVSGIVTALLALPLSAPLLLSTESYAWLALMGVVQMPIALVLITSGTRYLTSPEVSLFLLMETLFGPIWVWLVLGETVSRQTLVGGMIIIGTLVIYSWRNMQHGRGASSQVFVED
ncbi:MAG: DMT family transporter [Candidatus Sedimenticola sp. 20ELBAFRAG]